MIMDYLDLLLWPMLAALVLTGIHVYLGLHVVSRGVIFVDLALAQVAALGMSVGVILGMEHDSVGIYIVALSFALFAAGLFALTRGVERRFNQEAIIGIVYVVAAAAMILLLAKLPEGGEHLNHLLIGSILLVSPAAVIKTAILYGLLGMIHYRFRREFLSVSGLNNGQKLPSSVRFWDFLFYVTFGIVVTSSVQIAGILLVFSYLIIPAVAALLFVRDTRNRLLFGWGYGIVGSLLGMLFSLILDLPMGATIVVTFGLLLVIVFVVGRIKR